MTFLSTIIKCQVIFFLLEKKEGKKTKKEKINKLKK